MDGGKKPFGPPTRFRLESGDSGCARRCRCSRVPGHTQMEAVGVDPGRIHESSGIILVGQNTASCTVVSWSKCGADWFPAAMEKPEG